MDETLFELFLYCNETFRALLLLKVIILDMDTAKLSQLSDEVSRIARTLARLTMQPEVASTEHREGPANDGGQASTPIGAIRNAIQVRRCRCQFFDSELFADPAWDMLLHLYQAEITQLRVSVSSLCSASAVPTTTARRWITTMTDADLFHSYADPNDVSSVFVGLSPMASAGMRSYFTKIGELSSASD